MRRFLQLVTVSMVMAVSLSAGEVVDRIVATVNRQPVLLSDWETAMRYEAFLDQRPLPLPSERANATLDRLIDQELLREQMRTSHVPAVTAEEIATQIQEIRKNTAGCDSDAGFRAALARYGLSESELRERVTSQFAILRFLDVRLRPTVHIDRRSIEAYYNDTLLPELRQKGQPAASLADVSAQIEELLSQQRVDAILSDWLKDLRQQSEIHIQQVPAAPAVAKEAQ